MEGGVGLLCECVTNQQKQGAGRGCAGETKERESGGILVKYWSYMQFISLLSFITELLLIQKSSQVDGDSDSS